MRQTLIEVDREAKSLTVATFSTHPYRPKMEGKGDTYQSLEHLEPMQKWMPMVSYQGHTIQSELHLSGSEEGRPLGDIPVIL